MTDLLNVRERILNEVNDDERREIVRRDTQFLEGSIPYTAPEAMSDRWRELAEKLLELDRGGLILAGERLKICAILRESRDNRKAKDS